MVRAVYGIVTIGFALLRVVGEVVRQAWLNRFRYPMTGLATMRWRPRVIHARCPRGWGWFRGSARDQLRRGGVV